MAAKVFFFPSTVDGSLGEGEGEKGEMEKINGHSSNISATSDTQAFMFLDGLQVLVRHEVFVFC